MEKVLEELKEMSKFNSKKEEYDLKKEEIKQEKQELKNLEEKVKFTMVGTYDREIAQSNYENKKEELEKIEKEMSEDRENTLKEFEVQKNKVINAIDEEKGKYKYKTKDEIEALISQKNVYSKMIENSKKDIEKMINDVNEGKDIDMIRLKIARGEVKENSQKVEHLEKEIETAKSLEDGKEILSELEYLKLRVQNMNFDNLKDIKEDEFFKKYKKDEQEIEENQNDEKKIEENQNDEKNIGKQEKVGQEKNANLNNKEKDNTNNREDNNLRKNEKDDKENLQEIKSIEVKEKDKIVVCEYNSGKKETISLDQIEAEKKAMFKRLEIFSFCKDNSNTLLGAFLLYRKVNPAVIKAIGYNKGAISDYIDCLNNKKEFPFNLTHDLSGMSILQKIRKNRFVSVEEKCCASILGKIFSKNKALDEYKEDKKENPIETAKQRHKDYEEMIKAISKDREDIREENELAESLGKEVSQMMSDDENVKDESR